MINKIDANNYIFNFINFVIINHNNSKIEILSILRLVQYNKYKSNVYNDD